jgi:hypothetical protein
MSLAKEREFKNSFEMRLVGYPAHLPEPIAICGICRSLIHEPLESLTCGRQHTGCPFSPFVVETIYDRDQSFDDE